MDLKSGYPFWTVKNGLPTSFPPLSNDRQCDVLVVGAGITGALIADALCEAGQDVIVIDKRDAGWGSTAASTALLQYEIDTELLALAKTFGNELAVNAYRACEEAIEGIGEIAAKVGNVGYQHMQSLYLASSLLHSRRIRHEGQFRQQHGFDLQILDRAALLARFGVRAPVALLTSVAAQVDPYRLTYAILRRLQRRGVGVFDRSGLSAWKASAERVVVRTERGATIHCNHLIIAAGYESQNYLRQKVASNHSSYALVTEPLGAKLGIMRDTLLWESARPYLYMRSTSDQRLLVGGEDDNLDIAAKRDASVSRKSARLMRKLGKLLPQMNAELGFSWAGTFAETVDGLPFFGPHKQHGSRVHFAMAYGGNGIAFSYIGAKILSDQIKGATHPMARFFSFGRLR